MKNTYIQENVNNSKLLTRQNALTRKHEKLQLLKIQSITSCVRKYFLLPEILNKNIHVRTLIINAFDWEITNEHALRVYWMVRGIFHQLHNAIQNRYT